MINNHLTMYQIYFLDKGTHTDANGSVDSYTEKDFKEIADSYDVKKFESPIVIGHEDDLESLYTKKDSIPSYGWVKEIGADEKGLYAMADLAPELEELVERQVPPYKHISGAIYETDNPSNPVKGEGKYLRHIAFLGGQPPAIKGLPSPLRIYREGASVEHSLLNYSGNLLKNKETTKMKKKFYAEAEIEQYAEVTLPGPDASDEELKAFLNENSADYLSFILQSGEFAYPGEISRYEPEPTPENNYLFNPETQRYTGVFFDDLSTEDQGYEFQIGKTRDGKWFSAYNPVNTSEEGEDIPALMEEKTYIEETEEMKRPELPEEEENLPALAEKKPVLEEPEEEIIANGEKVVYAEKDAMDEFNESKKYAESSPMLNQDEESIMASQQPMTNEEEDTLSEGELPEINAQEEESLTKEEEPGVKAEVELMKEEASALRNEVLKLKTELNELRMNEFKSYAESKKDLLEAVGLNEQSLVGLMNTLDQKPSLKAYSEVAGKGNPVESFKTLMDNLEEKLKTGLVSFGEFHPDGEEEMETYVEDGDSNALYDEDSAKLHRDIVEYCNKNGMDYKDTNLYAKAYREVSSN